MSNIVKIGSFEIEVSPNHMYLTHDLPPTYDYVPWNLISNILNEGGRPEAGLIDIGANAGDSIAHFRRRSNATALGIEPEPSYFKMLKANARTLGNIDLRNALLVVAAVIVDELRKHAPVRAEHRQPRPLDAAAHLRAHAAAAAETLLWLGRDGHG